MLSSRSLKIAVLCAALAAGGCDRQAATPTQPAATASAAAAGEAKGVLDRSHKGSALPDFTLDRADGGGKLALAGAKGKPLLLNLWATWCAPCVAELPTLDTIAASGAARVLAVSEDSGKPAEVGAFLKARGVSKAEGLLDPKNDVAFAFGGGSLPTTVGYDASGREVWRFVGGRDWTSAESAALIAELK